jgi:hypothetical protein
VTGEATEEQRRRDPVKYVLAAVGVAILAAGVYAIRLPGRGQDVSYRVITIQVGDPSRVTVTFEVSKPPESTAECQVTTTGENNDVVNRLTGIVIPPAAERTTTHTVVVETDAPATSAAVASCVVTS